MVTLLQSRPKHSVYCERCNVKAMQSFANSCYPIRFLSLVAIFLWLTTLPFWIATTTSKEGNVCWSIHGSITYTHAFCSGGQLCHRTWQYRGSNFLDHRHTNCRWANMVLCLFVIAGHIMFRLKKRQYDLHSNDWNKSTEQRHSRQVISFSEAIFFVSWAIIHLLTFE